MPSANQYANYLWLLPRCGILSLVLRGLQLGASLRLSQWGSWLGGWGKAGIKAGVEAWAELDKRLRPAKIGLKNWVQIRSVTSEIFLIWAIVARTHIAWTNVTVTVGIC